KWPNVIPPWPPGCATASFSPLPACAAPRGASGQLAKGHGRPKIAPHARSPIETEPLFTIIKVEVLHSLLSFHHGASLAATPRPLPPREPAPPALCGRPAGRLVPRPPPGPGPPRLPWGKLAIRAGAPGRGKPLVPLALCPRLSTGRPFPDDRPGPGPANAIV